jgi:plastocyanin
MDRAARVVVGVLVAGMAMGAAGCGGGGDTSPSPTPNPATTLTITSSGVSPKTLTVARGSQVTFVNSDSRPHQMNSDPHPTHGDCPELDQVGFLNPGQSKTSGNLNTPRTCGYHDHINDTNTSFQGTIAIQ